VALDRISYGPKSWKILEVILDDYVPRVRIEQSDDDDCLRLSNVIYAIPIETIGWRFGTDEETLLSLHSFTLDAEQSAKRLTPYGIREDFLADFESFWYPLAALLDVYAEDFLQGLI
jgi:hypothetical protein